MECESVEDVKVATIKGLGVGVAYRDHVESDIRTGNVKILKIHGLESAATQSFILYQKDRPLSLNAQHFVQLAKRLP
jgi:hypothetical protein